MADIDGLVNALQEATLARRIGIPHDEARASYPLHSNTVRDWREFENIIADYYTYHYTRCVSPGGSISRTEALGQAKEILEQVYRRRRSDIVGAFNDARDGTNAGLRGVLDNLADGMKTHSTSRYVRDVWDSRVAPNDFEGKVALIRQFIDRFGDQLSESVQRNRPERYAQDYEDLVSAYVEGLRETSAMFRRL